MPASASDAAFEHGRWLLPAALLATLVAAASFHVAQNRLAWVGGGIAASKSLWLGIAIACWLVVPAFVAFDTRLAARLRRPFAWLLGLMAARGVVEGWMLYVTHTWSPLYGIGHDVLCGVVVAVSAARAGGGGRGGGSGGDGGGGGADGSGGLFGDGDAARDRRAILLRRQAFASAALFVPEIGFAAYMRAHFQTAGAQPVYFVPDDGAHAVLLAVTAGVDALALAWIAVFALGWLRD